jgi:hypothetical protein
LADDLEEYWKKHKYAVTHRKAVLYPRNDQERAEMNRQHATGQLPLGVRVIELTFAPSPEPLLHLMGEIREDSDEKTITLDYDRLYSYMDTQYLDNISHLQDTYMPTLPCPHAGPTHANGVLLTHAHRPAFDGCVARRSLV